MAICVRFTKWLISWLSLVRVFDGHNGAKFSLTPSVVRAIGPRLQCFRMAGQHTVVYTAPHCRCVCLPYWRGPDLRGRGVSQQFIVITTSTLLYTLARSYVVGWGKESLPTFLWPSPLVSCLWLPLALAAPEQAPSAATPSNLQCVPELRKAFHRALQWQSNSQSRRKPDFGCIQWPRLETTWREGEKMSTKNEGTSAKYHLAQ